MPSYLLRRLGQGIIVILVVTFVTFWLPTLEPGNIAKAVLGNHTTPAEIHAFLHDHGLDKGFFAQYFDYMKNLLHGNLGTSLNPQTLDEPVTQVIAPYVPRTFWLVLVSLMISVVLSIIIGMFQGLRRNTWFDHAMTFIVFLAYSIPAFVFSLFTIIFFGLTLNWFPVSVDSQSNTGFFYPLMNMFWYHPSQFVLPVMTLVVLGLGGLTRFMRGSILDTMVQDYIRTARAKGCSSRRVLFKHAFRNALTPIITIMGLALPGLFGGALITEQVFNYLGLGWLTVSSTSSRDVPVVMALTLIVTVLTVLGNILADVGLALSDPRIRLTGTR
jgi:peptide/nickel transport system permease protein